MCEQPPGPPDCGDIQHTPHHRSAAIEKRFAETIQFAMAL